MKIVNVNSADTGGQVERLSRMINREYKGEHESRGFIKAVNYIQYPYDVLYHKNWRETDPWIKEFWQTADVIHVHNRWNKKMMWVKNTRSDAGRIFHQHGRSPKPLEVLHGADRKLRAIRVVSTINLLGYVNENAKRWFPTPVDIPFLQRMRRKYRKEHDDIVIMHSPTQRHLKHTGLFLKVMKKLKEKYNVRELIVERQTYHETQKQRANADIVFDQLLLQHGSNGLESMAMGIPVVAGCIAAESTPDRIREICGELPFVEADEESLYKVLEQLIQDESMRKEYSRIGYDYVSKWHFPPYVTDLAIDTYKEAYEIGQRR